ncbi:MAG: phage tail sheath family protein [Chloroflexota bacterium]
MVTPTYPGVYVQELPSGVRTIAGVSTAVGAFVGYFRKGPMNEPVELLSFADFEREYGGLDSDSEVSYAISQFFINGGKRAYAVRVASDDPATAAVTDPATATVTAQNISLASALTFTAANPGTWGNLLRASIDYDTSDPAATFNLTVAAYAQDDGNNLRQVAQETWRNLSMTTTDARYVETVVNHDFSGSKLVQVTRLSSTRPAQTGTVSGDVSGFTGFTSGTPQIDVTIGTDGPYTLNLDPGATTVERVRANLENAIRAAQPSSPAFALATVSRVGDALRVVAGPRDASGASTAEQVVVFADGAGGADATTRADLALDAPGGVAANVQVYSLGSTAAVGFQAAGTAGTDGLPPNGTDLIGSRADKTGIYALEDVDLFNILCIPRSAEVSGANALTAADAGAVMTAAIAYCAEKRAFFIMDTPNSITEPADIREWLSQNATLRHRNAALFYPRVRIPDPLDENRLRSIGASGTMAGLFSRIDSSRGVWKAPAGIEARLTNVQRLDYPLTDAENGTVNPLGINALRNLPNVGNVAWGARTLVGADALASEWKYIPVRRLALFIEESLYRGLQWVVFEPNDEPLWAQIRLNVGAFMQRLFRQGAFEGATPREAYFVKCDADTTTATDRNLGIVNIHVGFAPLKPAEFVMLFLQQKTAESQS